MTQPIYPLPHPVWIRPLPGSSVHPAVASPVIVPLGAASAIASATLALNAPTILVLSSADGVSSATLTVTAPSTEPVWPIMGPLVAA